MSAGFSSPGAWPEPRRALPWVTLHMSLHSSVSVFPCAELTHCFQGTALSKDNGGNPPPPPTVRMDLLSSCRDSAAQDLWLSAPSRLATATVSLPRLALPRAACIPGRVTFSASGPQRLDHFSPTRNNLASHIHSSFPLCFSYLHASHL